MSITKETIIRDLQLLGINSGDTVAITADLLNVGFFNKNKKKTIETWIEILLECVGQNGTIIVPAYTHSFLYFKQKKDVIFHRFSFSTSGDLANGIINDTRSFRSSHPTNSIVAIGDKAFDITSKHGTDALSFSYMGDVIRFNGKFLMLGTVDKKNCPHSMHYAQEVLGQTKRNVFSFFTQYSYYYDAEGSVKLYKRSDLGACSEGGYKVFGDLIVNNAIKFGLVGNGFSAIMDAKTSFDVVLSILGKNPEFIKCNNKTCYSCYGRFYNSGFGIIPFYLYRLYLSLINKLK